MEETRYPLSFAQARLWFLHQVQPQGCAYNLCLALWLEGSLDCPAMSSAVDLVVQRHQVLHSRFSPGEGSPRQIPSPPPHGLLLHEDLSALPRAQAETRAQLRAQQEFQRPFDLLRSGPIRALLLRLGPDVSLLVITVHHIACDGWSLGVLGRELERSYTALHAGGTPQLPPLALQYGQYAQGQLQRISGPFLEAELEWWRQALKVPHQSREPRDLPALELGTPRGTSRGESLGARLTMQVPPHLLEALRQSGRRAGATLFMTTLAAFLVLLHRWTGQQDLVVGSPIAGRTRRETEQLIGLFVNMLVIRARVEGPMSFTQVLRQVRETALQAYAHQELPFEKLVEELAPPREPGRNPLFQVSFALQNIPRSTGRFADLQVVSLPAAPAATRFDLEVYLEEEPAGLRVSVLYAAEMFTRSTVQRLFDCYLRLLSAITENPDQPVSRLPLLSPAEQARLRQMGRGTQPSASPAPTVHQLFQLQAARSPQAVALQLQDRSLSYQQLNARANRLAAELSSRGVGPDVVVGLCAQRGPEMVVGMLGVLKAGGAYLPLDPEYPEARIAFMIKDAAAELLLCQERFRRKLPGGGLSAIGLDPYAQEEAHPGGENPASAATGSSLVYVMYTSGSTGRPKGVMVEHRGVVRLARDPLCAALGPGTVMLQLAPFSFDASTFEIWGALLNGGRLVMAPPGVPTPEDLGGLIRAHGVTTLWLTAALFHQAVRHGIAELGLVPQVLAGGDVLLPAEVNALLDAPGERTLVNGYGPTECTTFACCHVMKAGERVDERVPIGRAIAETQVYVLDKDMQLVPEGAVGELYIGGDGVARGYLNQPALTAERFVPDPFSPREGARLFRTGDRARWRHDGVLEFLGRLDRQVKLRGQRVEPGEVEAALRVQPGVRDAAVVPQRDGRDELGLVAFATSIPGATLNPAEIKRSLARTLPEAFLPAAVIPLAELPVSANGKVDREQLARRHDLGALRAPEHVPPRTAIEKSIAAIWQQVLAVERVGRDEDFFSLGGHSLLAAQVTARLRAILGFPIPIGALFEATTVRALGEYVETAMWAARGREESTAIPHGVPR